MQGSICQYSIFERGEHMSVPSCDILRNEDHGGDFVQSKHPKEIPIIVIMMLELRNYKLDNI
jgi:hypothetical protein